MSEIAARSFNDEAVASPEADAYGIAPFAHAVAEAFRTMSAPVGATIALNGPWGSGKTSAVNLIRHYLKPDQASESISVVDFRCWWFKGDEALTLAFLQELRGALELTLGAKAKELFGKLGRKMLQAGPIVGPAVNLATGGIWGALAGGANDIASKMLSEGEPLEQVMLELSLALGQQKKRYLVIIDDIDRLSPDEALQVFKLIKSVGRLPNVMYLAVFDREMAERSIRSRYPSEGPHFLEKIVQANFELPLPRASDLQIALLHEIEKLCGVPPEDKIQRFWNVFYDGVAPFITLPRHVTRLANSLAVTWPPLRGEVDLADYIALETLRLTEPVLYQAIRKSKDRICGIRRDGYGDHEDFAAVLDELTVKCSEGLRPHAKNILQRLFPRLETMGYGSEFLEDWDADRLICSPRHFETYFRLSLGEDVMSAERVRGTIANAGDKAALTATLLEVSKVVRRNGQSNLPVLFSELNTNSAAFDKGDIAPVVATFFALADQIDLARDEDRSSGFGVENSLRLHWLIRRLTRGMSIQERSELYLNACRTAPVGWLADFYASAYADHHPSSGKDPGPEEKWLVAEEYLPQLERLFLEALDLAAQNGTLLAHRKLGYIIFRWHHLGGDEGAAAREWAMRMIESDKGVAAFARAFTTEVLTHTLGMFGLGDRVSRRITKAGLNGVDKLLDIKEFRQRLEFVAENPSAISAEEHDAVKVFLDSWRREEAGVDDF